MTWMPPGTNLKTTKLGKEIESLAYEPRVKEAERSRFGELPSGKG
jgi:hypothetical protein